MLLSTSQHVGASCGGQSHLLPSGEALRAEILFFVQELVEDGAITVHYAKTQDQLADSGTKHLNKQRHRELINKIRDFRAWTAPKTIHRFRRL